MSWASSRGRAGRTGLAASIGARAGPNPAAFVGIQILTGSPQRGQRTRPSQTGGPREELDPRHFFNRRRALSISDLAAFSPKTPGKPSRALVSALASLATESMPT